MTRGTTYMGGITTSETSPLFLFSQFRLLFIKKLVFTFVKLSQNLNQPNIGISARQISKLRFFCMS